MNNLSTVITKKVKVEFIENAYSGLQQGAEVKGKCAGHCFREEVQGERNSSGCKVGVRRTTKGLEYNCFKASCQLGGGIVGSGDEQHRRFDSFHMVSDGACRDSGGISRQFAIPQDCVQGVSDHRRAWLSQFSIGATDIARYGISERQNDINGVYFPVYNLAGRYSGYLRREVKREGQILPVSTTNPKWLNQVTVGSVFISKQPVSSRTLVLVEDAVSAICVGKFHKSVALLGTYLGKEQLPNILNIIYNNSIGRVIIALDPDATDKAKKIEKDLTQYVSNVKAIITIKDPKYYDDLMLKNIGE